MGGQEIVGSKQIEIFKGSINPNSLRTDHDPMTGPNMILQSVIIGIDEHGEKWMNWDNVEPPKRGEDPIELLKGLTDQLIEELEYNERIMQVKGFIRRRKGRKPLLLEWEDTFSLWIPFSEYKEYATKKVRKDWERQFQSMGIKPE